MSRYERTPTAVEVVPLDLSEIEADALAWLRDRAAADQKHGVKAEMPTAVRAGFKPWGIVETPRGLYALCNEGVGPDHPVTDEQKCQIDLYVDGIESDGSGTQALSIFPACSVSLGPDRLRELATGEPHNLSEHIRSFGGRLHANYEGWRRRLESAMEVTA